MRTRRFFAALASALLLGAWPCARAPAATLLVTSPASPAAVCVTSPDASFDYRWGVLDAHSGLFSYSPPGAEPLVPAVAAAQEALPGALVRIRVSEPEDLDSLTAEIVDSHQKVQSRGIGFRPDAAQEAGLWVVLVGISAWTRPGTYTLSVTAAAGDRRAVFLSPLVVRERSFRFERIALNLDLTELRTEKDPRKIAEAKEMAHILTTPHPDAVYEQGAVIIPLPAARRTSGYGDRRRYVYTDKSSDFSVHEGLDLAAPEGTPVPACGRGRVVLAATRIMTGNTVVIEHLPGLFSLYFHMSEMDVKAGDVVSEGQVIGKVGKTGLATGPHLHWEIADMGVPVDPDALAAGPILDRNLDFGDIGKARVPKGGE